MIIRVSIFLLFLYSILSCASTKEIKFELNTNTKVSLFLIRDAPEPVRIKKIDLYHGRRAFHYIYDDGSTLFITDLEGGSTVYGHKQKKYGDGIFTKIILSDSIDISGEYDGLFWRELKTNRYVTFGYFDVASDKKDFFDDLIENHAILK